MQAIHIPDTITTQSAEHTMEVGKACASLLEKDTRPTARIVLLRGDLGAGKTTFAKGFLSYFHIAPHQASPTFVIARRYPIDTPTTKAIVHIDAYRLSSQKDWEGVDLHKEERDPNSILLVEWPDNIEGKQWNEALSVRCEHGATPNERTIVIS